MVAGATVVLSVGVTNTATLPIGYRVRRNDPYAGGYVTRHYGRPREGVHALQIEVERAMPEIVAEKGKVSVFPDLFWSKDVVVFEDGWPHRFVGPNNAALRADHLTVLEYP